MPRVVDLPNRGTLIAATDLQGNLNDYLRLEEIFVERRLRDEHTYFVLTGDLIHGPEFEEDEWPEQLGSYYWGASAAVLERAQALEVAHQGHVFYLMGNHEHAHVGGLVVGKFFSDEAKRLEEILGPERSEEVRAWVQTWPLVCVAESARLALLHGAPHAAISSRADIEAVSLDELVGLTAHEVCNRSVLGAILWARGTTEERARMFLKALSPHLTTAIYGHDVVREGYAIENAHCLCVSSSFGCHDGDKVYVEWDLSEPALSAYDVARRGMRRLWPNKPPYYAADRWR